MRFWVEGSYGTMGEQDMMNLHFIDPPAVFAADYSSNYKLPSLALGYLAACARRAGHKVKITDAAIEGWKKVSSFGRLFVRGLGPNDIIAQIQDRPDVIGITVLFSAQWPLVVDLCARLREHFKDTLIVLGGEHPSAVPGFCLKSSVADVVVIGEGEETFLELLTTVVEGSRKDWHGVRGLAFTENRKVVFTPPRARILDLDRLPFPAWDLFVLEAYEKEGLGGASPRKGASPVPILASRGCPFSCRYCTAPQMWGRCYVARSPVSVADEMARNFHDFQSTYSVFCDQSFGLNQKWLFEFCQELERLHLPITWEIVTRPEVINGDNIATLRRAGLCWVSFGYETDSPRMRKKTKRKGETPTILKAIRTCHQAGVTSRVQLQVGFPHESLGDALSNLTFVFRAAKAGVDMIGPTTFVPYPGTAMFFEMVRSGDLVVNDELFEFSARSNGLLPCLFRFADVNPLRTKTLQYLLMLAFLATRLLFRPNQAGRILFPHLASPLSHLMSLWRGSCNKLWTTGKRGVDWNWPKVDWAEAISADLNKHTP